MMKRNTKIFSLIMAACMSISLYVPAYAAELPNELKEGNSPISEEVSDFLDNSQTTQTMVISEQELIDNMIDEGVITREDLNQNLEELASQSEADLRDSGYNDKQISTIMSYEEGEDAYNHIYNSGVMTRSTTDTSVIFRYGLAGGNNTRRQVTIAYDMTWTSCPFWAFTDSFGVGWVAADNKSGYLATKIDSSMASVDYFTVDGENAGFNRDVEMDTFSNRAVIGNPVLGKAQGNYGKHISGITKVSTQSNSYNMDTIQVFVAYAHTMMTISFSWEVSLGVDISDTAIVFSVSPDVTQEMMVKDNHTFKYNADNVIVA